MPSRTTGATATEVEEYEEERQLTLPGLQFNQPLSWRAGKPIAIADLLRRLQALSKEMRGMEQEEDERDSFTTVAKELVNSNLLAHKDKGVRAWTACCLVDILRLCAPDAPYTGQQLKDIFNMLITSILPALADPSNAYNQQHLYVLTSLASVKSIVLLADIPSSEQLTTNLFTTFFDILASSSKSSTGEQLGKNVEFNMTSILTIMVDESETLPTEVVDVIVAQFLRVDPRAGSGNVVKSKKNAAPVVDERQSTLSLKELPTSYNMAKTICNTCADKMSRQMSQYFNDIVIDASESSVTAKALPKKASHRKYSDGIDDSDQDIAMGPTEEDLRELRKAHQLVREMWRACPNVLQNVIPQLEAELNAENVHLRLLGTETLGDIISGIGAAGLPPPPSLDPSIYPPIRLSDTQESASGLNVLTKPSSPQPFHQVHPQAYTSFLRRVQDKSATIRAAWATSIGRILSTSGGGVGLAQQEESRLTESLARVLGDGDEKVRIAAVRAVGSFSLRDVVFKLGVLGGVESSGTVLGNLAERVRDKKQTVRAEAMNVLARLWGVAAGEIAAGDERVILALGGAPSKILDTYYANDLEIHALLDHVLFEKLLPLNFPPTMTKGGKPVNIHSQKNMDSQAGGDVDAEAVDPDKLRTERILVLVKDLDERAKKVFLAVQSRQIMLAKVMGAYLQRCEDYNGGVMDQNEKDIEDHMSRLIETLTKSLPDATKAREHLRKFAKMHDRRSYQLIRFCLAPETDYRTVVKAIKEFTKRIEQSSTAPQDLLNTLRQLLYRVSVIVYNKSHVPGIMEFSRLDSRGLAATAHEILRDISNKSPEILKAHVQEICHSLQEGAPGAKNPNDPGALDNLKACAAFASKFADEMPRDRKFIQAMSRYALHGTPAEVAKHAITIVMGASDKKELLAKDLVHSCVKGFEYGSEGYLSRLASLSQLMLLAPQQTNQEADAISSIAIDRTLLKTHTSSREGSETYEWSLSMDSDCEAKCWALKILANRLRSHTDPDSLSEIASPVYQLLSKLITEKGELLPSKDTPPTHKPRLRLLAAQLCLKLSLRKATDSLLTPTMFNDLSLVAQDSILTVRAAFLKRLKKYLGQTRLPQRFHVIPFLLAFEPDTALKVETTTWIRSRATHFHNLKLQDVSSKVNMIMEFMFARLISLLAHHLDYAEEAEDLTDFAHYIIFYLQCIAREENLSIIYHIAQRIKQSRDAIATSVEYDRRLYHLSDLAQLTVRKFEDAHGWNIETLPGKIRLPSSLYLEVKDHGEAQKIAEHNYLPEDVEDGVEALIKTSIRAERLNSKKRRSDADHRPNGRDTKKVKSLPIRKAPLKEKKARPSASVNKTPRRPKKRQSEESEAQGSERRRSGRVKIDEGTYRERGDDEDDREMGQGVASWKYENDDEDEDMDDDQSPPSVAEKGSGSEMKTGNREEEPEAINASEDVWEMSKSPSRSNRKRSPRAGPSPNTKSRSTAAAILPTKGAKKSKAKGR